MTLLNTTEDNCVWDTEEGECYVPTECEDLGSKAKCDNFAMYPTVDVTGGACKYNNKRGCFLNVLPTSCEEVISPKQCKNSEKRYGFECFYVAKECIEPPTTCAEIPTKGMCNSAYAKLGFYCSYEDEACVDAPVTCEEIASRRECRNAGADYGIAGCDWNAERGPRGGRVHDHHMRGRHGQGQMPGCRGGLHADLLLRQALQVMHDHRLTHLLFARSRHSSRIFIVIYCTCLWRCRHLSTFM